MGCHGSKIASEAYAPQASKEENATKKFPAAATVQSVVLLLDDPRCCFSETSSTNSSTEACASESGIECSTAEDSSSHVNRIRVQVRQQRAFDKHVHRESTAAKNRSPYNPKRVRSWNSAEVALPQ